jgi:hypothetical protein
MGILAVTQQNFTLSNLSGKLNKKAQAKQLQGAIAHVKLNNAKPNSPIRKNVEIIFQNTKLNMPSSDVTVFSSGLGGLRRGDTKVTYGNYSEYGSNVLQLAGAVVTAPITGTIGAFISVIYASAELNEAYKAYLAGDKKGVIFHLGLAGISAIPACKQILKAFSVLRAAKIAPKVAARIKTGEEIRAGFSKIAALRTIIENNKKLASSLSINSSKLDKLNKFLNTPQNTRYVLEELIKNKATPEQAD